MKKKKRQNKQEMNLTLEAHFYKNTMISLSFFFFITDEM